MTYTHMKRDFGNYFDMMMAHSYKCQQPAGSIRTTPLHVMSLADQHQEQWFVSS